MVLYTMEFYSATKKNEILSFAGKWMEVENVILSKGSQAQKTKNHMFSLMCGLSTQNKCSNVIGCGTHTEGRPHTGRIGKGKETQTLNVVDKLTV
jgi:hypothetical protein